MVLCFGSIFVNITVGLLTILFLTFIYFKDAFRYWTKKKVPYIEPSFPFGNSENPFTRKTAASARIKTFYDEFKSQGHKHGGIYTFAAPRYIPVDPEYVKNVLSKDFQHFTDRGMYYNEEADPLSAHLFSIGGAKWRNIRTKLTPTFTSGKMKMMFPIIVECGAQLEEAVGNFYAMQEPMDIKEIMGNFTTDVIGSCAFGLDCNSFKNPNSDFRKYGKRVFTFTKMELFRGLICVTTPKFAKFAGLSITPKDVSDFFLNVVKDTVNYRKEKKVFRKDFLQLLMDLKNNGKLEQVDDKPFGETETEFSIEEIAAQAFVFFLAGFETSSTAMTFCLYELASNSSIQDKVREEILRVLEKNDGNITYEGILEMKYMQQVIDETLRKYPPLSLITRKCTKTYNVPGTDVQIEEGTAVTIPILPIHHDPEFYPDPEKFDPQRFTEENRSKRHAFTYIPFGEGPRVCIGLRFGLMQVKVGLTILLSKYKFTLNSRTQIPLEMDPFTFALATKGGIWLNTEKVR